jgi:hypothetical protein
LFEYCERYMIAFQDKSYGELVLHAPPINLICILMLPFTLIPSRMDEAAEKFSLTIYWVENIMGMLGFLVFEICLLPLVYVMTYFNIAYSCNSPLQLLKHLSTWTLLGFFFLIHILANDVHTLFIILSKYRGCKETHENHIAQEEV